MIDSRADIHPNAKIADDVVIGPWSIIGDKVEIASGSEIGPHVVIKGPTKIGKNNAIYQFASVGEDPQDITYRGEDTTLEIGDGNVIREYCTVNRGSTKGDGTTRLGNNNFLMAYAHVGHDCVVGNNVIMVNYCALSGHVIVGDYANIGAYSAVHQFCHVGEFAFIARATYITKDVLPYVMIAGHTASACGLNTVGLKRNGFNADEVDHLRRAYKIIFRRGLTVQQAVVELFEIVPECEKIRALIDFIQSSNRGIVR